MGKSHAAVSDIERGITDIAISDLYAIAHLFGVPVSEFLEGDNQKPPISFAQNRFAKDITPAEKKEAEQAIKDFDEQVLKEFLDKK